MGWSLEAAPGLSRQSRTPSKNTGWDFSAALKGALLLMTGRSACFRGGTEEKGEHEKSRASSSLGPARSVQAFLPAPRDLFSPLPSALVFLLISEQLLFVEQDWCDSRLLGTGG